MMLFVLSHWTATALSYQTVLSPLVAIALSAWLLDEPLTGGLFLGSILVIAGVTLGALAPGVEKG
jgi:drug/metabolite transporter (DMT)-like permease